MEEDYHTFLGIFSGNFMGGSKDSSPKEPASPKTPEQPMPGLAEPMYTTKQISFHCPQLKISSYATQEQPLTALAMQGLSICHRSQSDGGNNLDVKIGYTCIEDHTGLAPAVLFQSGETEQVWRRVGLVHKTLGIHNGAHCGSKSLSTEPAVASLGVRAPPPLPHPKTNSGRRAPGGGGRTQNICCTGVVREGGREGGSGLVDRGPICRWLTVRPSVLPATASDLRTLTHAHGTLDHQIKCFVACSSMHFLEKQSSQII